MTHAVIDNTQRNSLASMRREASTLILFLTILLIAVLLLSGKIIARQTAVGQAQQLHEYIDQLSRQISAQPASNKRIVEALLNRPEVIDGHASQNGQVLTLDTIKHFSENKISALQQRLGATQKIETTLKRHQQTPLHISLTLFSPFAINLPLSLLGASLLALIGLTLSARLNQIDLQKIDSDTNNLRLSTDSTALDVQPSSKIEPVSPSLELSKKELELARESALKANRFKSRLISNTSHELLTPLNSIIGFSKLLESRLIDQDDKELLDYIQFVIQNAEHVNSLVNDLVVFADRNKPAQTLDYKQVDLFSLINSIHRSLESEVQKKGLAFPADIDSLSGLYTKTDPVRLRQIIYNLIVNAIRYTEHGEIKLSALIETKGEYPLLKLSVQDTGQGIAPDEQQNIFSAFVTSNESTASTNPDQPGLGLGLGLTIASQLARLLGGEISLSSELGMGSCFTLALPLHDCSAPSIAAADIHTQTTPQPPTANTTNTAVPLAVLVVDDTPANNYLVEQLLRDSQWAVVSTHSAEKAVALAKSQHFDAMILDIRMSPIDGYTLFSQIRELPDHQHTPIIACTAHTNEIEYRQLVEYGFSQILHKPVSNEGLIAALHHVTDTPGPIHQKATPSTLPTQSSQPLTNTVRHDFFNTDVALRKAGGNTQVAKNIFELLIADLTAIKKQHQTLDISDKKQLIDMVHKIHGAAALSGTITLKNLSAITEDLLKTAPSTSASDNAVLKLFSYVDQLLNWAKQNINDPFNEE